MILWHYTTQVHLPQILLNGRLRLTPKKPTPGQVQGVWFTTSPDWEPTAAKRMKLRDQRTGEETDIGITSFEELHHKMGIARIGVEDSPEYLTFKQYARICSPEWVAHLVGASQQMTEETGWEKPCGPDFWRVSLYAVDALKFKKIELFDFGEWRSCELRNDL